MRQALKCGCVALIVITSMLCLNIAFDQKMVREFLGAKLTLLAVLGALGVFQYQLFRSIAQWALTISRGNDPALSDDREQIRSGMESEFLPHNEAIIYNILFGVICLLLSIFIDLYLILLGRDKQVLRVFSTALIIAVLLLALEIIVRYYRAMGREFSMWKKYFRSPSSS